MNSLEIRIKAVNTFPNRGEHDESASIYINPSLPLTAASILKELRTHQSISNYIDQHTIPAEKKNMPVIENSLDDQGEFSFSLPSTIIHSQRFVVRII